jgi:hypothetical protein
MAKKTYINDKEVKKNFALKGIWLLIVLAVIFSLVLLRFVISGTQYDHLNDQPNNEDAYSIARAFIKPTIKFSNVTFPESGYQCAQKPDSVYIIKSYVEAKNKSGEKNITTFQITLRFNGGAVADKKNWKVLSLSEN